MLTVFNVGQGDSFLLKAHDECMFNEPPLLIDTGSAIAKIASRISNYNELYVLITHSHTDHIGGLPGIIRSKTITKIYIPYFLAEISKINSYLKKYTKSNIASPNWKRIKKLNFELVAQDDKLCDHIQVFNPPRIVADFNWGKLNENDTIEAALRRLAELRIDLNADEIVNYSTPIFPEEQNNTDQDYKSEARKFVHSFFISLSNSLDNTTLENIDYYINRHFELTSHQVSVVFKYSHDDGSDWLFTGDADKSVFDRLIFAKKDISAKYLKIPHHGSRENISEESLTKIAPKYAIVSHNNRKFGQSKDPHPHHEVINLLDKHGVTCYYTNPVTKDKLHIKEMTSGSVLNGLIEFVQPL